MSRYVDTSKKLSLDDIWYLQQRGELPEDVEPLTVDQIGQLRDDDNPLVLVRHTEDIPEESRPNTGVATGQLDAGPERDAGTMGPGTTGSTYVPESVKERQQAAARERGEDWEGGNAKGLFGAEPMDLDTDQDSEQAKAANDRIRKRQSKRTGSSVHEAPQEAERRDPEHPANVAEREAQAAEQETRQAVAERDAARRQR